MPDLSKIESIRANLIKEGYEMPDVNTMAADLQDESKLSSLYETLKKEKFDVPEFETFRTDLGLKKKDGTTPSSTSSADSPSSESGSTSKTPGNPFEFTLDEAKNTSQQPALPDPKNILLRPPVPQNGELGTPEIQKWDYTGPTRTKIIQATIADPVYKTLTTTEKQSLINTKLIENGLTTPERVAQEQAAEAQKTKSIDEQASKDIGIKISDFENAGRKTVYYDGRNYDNTKVYHLNDTDYAILNDGRKVKYQGDQWVSVNNQEANQLDSATATTQKEFFDTPQNITKNLFVGQDEQQYVQAANKYLYNLRDSDPALYEDISRQLLGKRGHDFFTATSDRIDINQKDIGIQKIKKEIIENSQIANVDTALEDLNVIAKRVGAEKIQKYRELSAIPDGLGTPIINNTFSPGEIEDIQKVIDYSGQIKSAKDNINFANQNLVKDAYQQEVKQKVYDAVASVDQTGLYSGIDAIKTIWNTTVGAANGTMGLIKKLDRDNQYGAIDLWTDSFNEAAQNLQMTTANRQMFGEGGFDPKAVLPAVAQGVTSMYLFGRGGNILSEAGLGYNAGIVASSFAIQHNDYYQQARGKMTDLQANDFSTFATGLTSMLELVSPGEAIWGKEGLMHMTLDEVMTKYAKGESFDSIIKPLLKEVGKEDIQEVSQDLGDIMANGAANTILGKDTLNTEYNLNQFLETVTTTTLATALSGGFSGINIKGQDRNDVVNKLSGNDGIMNVALSTIQNNVNAGLISQDKANSLTEELVSRNAELKALPDEWNDIKKGRIVDLQNELSKYEQKQFTVDEKGQLVEQDLSQTDQKAIMDLNKKIINLSALPNEHFDNELRTQQERAAQLLKGNPTPVASALSGVGETKTPQEAAYDIESLKETANQILDQKDFTVGEMINTPVVYNGQNGSIYQDGQTLVFKVNGQNKEFELGNVDQIKDRPLSDFGIKHEQSVVSFGDNGEINIREKTFVNNFSDPLAAINRDSEGNIVSVNLETEDGKKRTFRGNVAEDIAYQLHLQKISNDEAAQEEFINHINQDEKAQELINAGLSEATTVPSTENNAGVPRQKIEPITKPEEIVPPPIINPQSQTSNESQSNQDRGEEKSTEEEGKSDQGNEGSKVVLTTKEEAGVDKKAPAKPSTIEDGKKRRAALEEIETSEKEFIDSISPDHSRYLAGLLLDGYTKDEIELTKKVRDAFKEIDGTDNFGKIFKTLRENDFDVEAVISEIGSKPYDQETTDTLITTLREIGKTTPIKTFKEKSPVYIDNELNQDDNLNAVIEDLQSQGKEPSKENILSGIDETISLIQDEVDNGDISKKQKSSLQKQLNNFSELKSFIENSNDITFNQPENATTESTEPNQEVDQQTSISEYQGTGTPRSEEAFNETNNSNRGEDSQRAEPEEEPQKVTNVEEYKIAIKKAIPSLTTEEVEAIAIQAEALKEFSEKEFGLSNAVAWESTQGIIGNEVVQAEEEDTKGAANIDRGITSYGNKADISTALHEPHHHFLNLIDTLANDGNAKAKEMVQVIDNWTYGKEGRLFASREDLKIRTPEHRHEFFARSAEKYFMEGKRSGFPERISKVFDQFKTFLSKIYDGIVASPQKINISPELRGLFDSIYGKEKVEKDLLTDENTKEQAKTEKTIENKISQLEDDSPKQVLEQQKKKLLQDLNDIEDILIGEDGVKRKTEILSDKEIKKDKKGELIFHLYPNTNEQVIEGNSSLLKAAGFEVNDGKIKIPIYKDGEVNIGDVRTAIETVESEFPNNDKFNSNTYRKTSPSLITIGNYDTLESAKQSLQDATENLETAKKNGNKGLIEMYSKQLKIEKDEYNNRFGEYDRNKKDIQYSEDRIKEGQFTSIYDIDRLLELPLLKAAVKRFETGKNIKPEEPDYDLAKKELIRLLGEAEVQFEAYTAPLRKKDGTIKASISKTQEISVRRLQNSISELKDKIDGLGKEQKTFNQKFPERPLTLRDIQELRRKAKERRTIHDNTDEGNNPPPGDEESTGEPENNGPDGITHAAIAELRDEFNIEAYEKEVITDQEMNEKADEAIKKGYDIEALLQKLENGSPADDLETFILGKYKALLDKRLASDPSNKNITQAIRFANASDLAGSIQGRSFRARRFLPPVDATLGDYFVRKAKANLTTVLTDTQKADVIKEFNDIKAAKEALEQKIKDLQEEKISKEAQKEVTRSRAPKAKVTKSSEDFTKERADILKNIRDKWNQAGKGDNMVTSVLIPLPFKKIKQLVAVAPDVKDLMKSLVQEGVTKLDQIVDNIHSLLKNDIEDLNKNDIRDIIAGVYNEPQRTRTEIAVQLEDLRTEAKLLKQLDDLENGIVPTEEKKIRRRNQAITDLRNKITELKKQLGASNTAAPERDKLDTIKSNLKRRITKLENDLKTGNFTSEKKGEPIQLDQEAIDLKDKLIKLQIDREKKLLQDEYANRTNLEKAKSYALEILNLPRTLMSSFDFSAPLRQGLIPTIAHPMIAGPALIEMFRQAVSQKRFDRWFHDLRDSEGFKIMEQSGLYVADPHDIRLAAKEEYFMNNLAEKIPVIGKVVKGSERAYVSYLNKMRVDLFKQGAELLETQGKTFTNSPETYQGLARMINAITGRGELGVLETAAPVLNTIFFSPRLIASRLSLINPVFYARLPKEVRKMALKDMAKFIGFGLSILGLMKFGWGCPDKKSKGCITVEDDPRSTDFGKIKSGNTRYDIWGGFQQYVRFLTQMFTGEKIKPKTGKVQELNGKEAFGTTRGDVAGAFIRGKLAPIPSTIVDVLKGRTATGEKVTLTDEMENKLLPLLYSDVKDAMKEQGIKGLFTVGLPAAFGVGVQTFDEKKSPSKK